MIPLTFEATPAMMVRFEGMLSRGYLSLAGERQLDSYGRGRTR